MAVLSEPVVAHPSSGNGQPRLAAGVGGKDASLQRSLHRELLGQLRGLINHGDLAPGAKVDERALCTRFSISRTPLREALKVLAAEGLVELLPNRGARIAALDASGLDHLFETIGLLEAEGGRLAARRIGEDALAEIRSLHYRMHAHFLRCELPGYFACNQQIHDALMRACANPVLVATHAGLAGRILRARYMANRLSPERWAQAMSEHEAILDALGRRDADELGGLLRRHLANKCDMLAEQLHAPTAHAPAGLAPAPTRRSSPAGAAARSSTGPAAGTTAQAGDT